MCLESNVYYTMNHAEYISIDDDSKSKWFIRQTATSITCPICGNWCHLEFNEDDDFVICPNTSEIIDITDEQRFKYVFKFDEFLCELQKEWKVEKREGSWENFSSIGSVSYKQDKWLIMFGLGNERTNSIGKIMELRTHFPQDYILLVVNEPLKYEETQKQILNNMGVFLANWEDSLELTFNRIYGEKEKVLLLTRDALSAGAKQNTKVVMSALKHAATTAQGTEFERQVYKVLCQLFQVVMPFGSNYTGISIPDGLISEGDDKPYPIMFYDCKSFKGTDYVHKAEIPMQVNYYENFLEDFFFIKNSYKNTGFIIFANDYSDKAKSSIIGSPQWKYVEGKCTIFFINVKSLEKAESIMKEYFTQGNFKSSDFYDICFHDKTSSFYDRETEKYYQELFNVSTYSNFRFIDENKMEITIIAAILNATMGISGRDSLDEHLKLIIKKSMHDNKVGRVRKPIVSSFLNSFIEDIKKGTIEEKLQPISILLTMKRFDDHISNVIGDDKYNEVLAGTRNKIKELLKGVQ